MQFKVYLKTLKIHQRERETENSTQNDSLAGMANETEADSLYEYRLKSSRSQTWKCKQKQVEPNSNELKFKGNERWNYQNQKVPEFFVYYSQTKCITANDLRSTQNFKHNL